MKTIVVVRCLIEADNNALFIKKASNSSRFSNCYELPGGKVEDSEDLEQALSRELAEEIGTSFKDYALLHAYAYTQGNDHAIVITYKTVLGKTFTPTLSEEHTEYTWVTLEEAVTLDISEEAEEVINKLDVVVDKKTTQKTEVKLYTDGGSRGNPGPSALGYVIYDLDENVVKKDSEYLGITTNNQAEYQAVKAGLKDCLDLGADKISVFLDSQLVANQMNGIYKVKNRDLWPIHDAIKKLSEHFKGGVEFTYIPREYNKEADAMVNYALDNNID